MALFSTQEELAEFIPTNATFSLEKIKPTLLHVQRSVLEPYCGAALIRGLDAANDESSLSEKQATLLKLVRPPLALIAMCRYIPLGEVQIDLRGVTKFEGSDRKAADNAQILRLRMELYEMGYDALQYLLDFLETNVGDYTEHQVILDARPASLLPNARTFSGCYPIFDSHLTYLGLVPALRQIEEDTLMALLGDTYAVLLANDALSTPLTKLRRKAQRALAYLTVAEAISTSMAVELSAGGLRLNYTSQIGNVKYYAPPPEATRLSVLAEARHKANGLLDQMARDLALILDPEYTGGSGMVDNTGSKIVML
jgi:hypothetical protein